MVRRLVPMLLVCVLAATACGARLSDEQRAAVLSGGGGDGSGQQLDGGDQSTATTVAGDATATTVAGSPGATTAGGATGGGGGGTSTGGAAGGGGGGATAAGATCGGGGKSDVGVTETEIKIGNVSTISGPIPGFGQTGVNAVKAYVNYVNANGGVCGRKLVLVTGDDRLQSGTNKSETDKLKTQVLGFVGGTTVVDDGAAASIGGSNIANAALAISDAMIKSPNNFPTTPIDPTGANSSALGILKYMKAVRGVTKAALVYPAQASAEARANDYKRDLAKVGIALVADRKVAVTETNYADDAAAIEAAKADMVLTALELSGMARLAKAMDQNGYFPKVPFYGSQAYGRLFIQQAGKAAETTVLGVAYHIFEEAGSVPAVKEFLTWYERTNPGQDIDFFAIESWTAADMFVTALRGVKGAPTRDAVMAQLKAMTAFDAHGFKPPYNPGAKKPSNCFLVTEVENGKWIKTHPAGNGFECGY